MCNNVILFSIPLYSKNMNYIRLYYVNCIYLSVYINKQVYPLFVMLSIIY